jgi:RND family efflux transporter MFP subunit
MVIAALLYILLVWLLFFRLRWLRWSWLSGGLAIAVGFAVIAAFDGFLNRLAPEGRIAVIGRVVEITPNVSGQIVDISVRPNQPVRAGSVLFNIDRTPYEAKTRAIQAQATFADLRLSQMAELESRDAGRAFDVQQRRAESDQLRAQLDAARYDLDQTTIVAPADGYVSILSLSKGDRATSLKSVMSFIVSDSIQIVGVFSQNGLPTIKPGAKVQLSLASNPGRIYDTTVASVVGAIGEGQIASSGTLARITSSSMTSEYPVNINHPPDLDPALLRPGLSGTATVYAPNSAPFDLFGWVLLFGRSLALYL